MSVLSKLQFAAQNPGTTYRFARRELTRRVRKQQAQADHLPTPRNGAILSTHFFDTAHFDHYKNTRDADRILAGELCLYGQHCFKLEGKINWHRDYLSEYTWPTDIFAQDIAYTYPIGTDIKNPWEISRAHHLVTVGMTYRATGDEKYARYIVEAITDWITTNPFYLGVNWKVAMEVGIRASNWLLAHDLISTSSAVTSEFTALFLGSLAEHGSYIMENLEYFGVRSNHYMSDLVGLIWIGTLCPSLPNAKKWQRFAVKELATEILHQFYADGINFEGSTAYQRLVLELVGYTLFLLQKHEIALSAAVQNRARIAFAALSTLVGPDGTVPQIGDNDTGRMFIFSAYHEWESLEMPYIRDLAHLIFPDLPAYGSEEFSWCITEKPLLFSQKNQTFVDGGIMIAHLKKWHLVIANSPIGQDGNGGHNHDDNGSFELCYGTARIIVDAGTGCYTSNPEVRNHFRSVRAHNAPVVEHLAHEPHQLLFVSDQFTKSTITAQSDNHWLLRLTAEKYTAEREITLKDTGLDVSDSILVPEKSEISTFLIFPPSISVIPTKDGFQIGEHLLLKVTSGTGTCVEAHYSPSYATILPTHGIRITGRNNLKFSLTPQ